MEDEHLDTIPAMESDEFIKSSVENLIPILRESDFFLEVNAFLVVEDEPTSSQFPKSYLNPEGDMLLFKAFLNDDHSSDIKTKSSSTSLNSLLEETNNFDNSLPEFTTFSKVLFDAEYESDSSDDQSCSDEDVLEKIISKPLSEEEIIPMKSLHTHDSSLPISSKIDSLLDEFAGELTLIKLIPSGIDETDCDFEEDIRLIEKLLYDNSSPHEFIKSCVENLVPNPSESEGESECDMPAREEFSTFSNILFNADYEFDSSDDQLCSDEDVPEKIFLNPLFEEEIIPIKIDQHHDNAESTHDSSLIISSKIDSLLDEFAGELILLKSIPPGIDETDCHPENEICFSERLLYDNSSPCPPEEFVSKNSNANIESFFPSLIPNEDSDSFMEEIELFLTSDDPMPSSIEDDDDNSERDILIREELIDNYSLSLIENESFRFDILSFFCPPAKPPDGNTEILNIKMMGDISDQKQEEKQIEEDQAANARYWKILACCDDEYDYNFAITPNEPVTSLIMGDEHLNTILATKSDEFINSSVENLVLNLKKIFSNPLFVEEIISMKIDQHHDNAESDLVESLRTHDYSLIISSKIDSLLDEFADELTLLKSISLGIDETDCDPKEGIHLIERLLYDNSSPRLPEEFVSKNSNADIKSFSSSPIPIKDKFLDNYSLSLRKNESFHFDIPSSSRPPAKAPDGNTGILNIKMVGDISEQKVPMHGLKITRVSNQEKPPDLLSDQRLENFQPSAECPMMIHGKNTPILDVPLFHFYPHDQFNIPRNVKTHAKGFCPPSLHFLSFIRESYEFAGELTFLKLIPPGIDEADCDFEEDIHLIEKLLYDNSSPRPPEEFVSANADAKIKSFSPSPILVKDSDSLMEEIDLFCTLDYLMPTGIDYDSERDILILKDLPSNNSLSFAKKESLLFLRFLVILQNHQMEKSPDFISHRCGTVKIFNTYRSHLNECPMMIHG
nr:hypothetical protein [Tanacetum cinerariifolium]